MIGEAVADRVALRALVEAYAAAVDTRDESAFVALFLADGVLSVFPPGADDPGATFTGADGLREVSGLLGRWEATAHHVTGHHCRIDAGVASGRTSCLAHHLHRSDGRDVDHQMVIAYEDRYARGADGVWRFRRRDVRILWTVDVPASLEPRF